MPLPTLGVYPLAISSSPAFKDNVRRIAYCGTRLLTAHTTREQLIVRCMAMADMSAYREFDRLRIELHGAH